MASGTEPKSPLQRVAEVRARLRTKGLRPIEIWISDVNSPEFAVEAHRQSLAVAQSPYAQEDQAFVDAISDRGDE